MATKTQTRKPVALALARKNGASEARNVPTIIQIQQPKVHLVTLRLRGTSTLLLNRMTEETLQGIADGEAHQGPGKKAPKGVRNPDAEFEGHKHKVNGGTGVKGGYDGFPAIGVIESLATAGGMRFGGDRSARIRIMSVLSIDGEGLLKINGPPATMNRDWSPKVKSPIYRPEYRDWYIDVPFRFDETDLSAADLVALAMNAGLKVGLGAHRKERNGLNGMFEPEVINL